MRLEWCWLLAVPAILGAQSADSTQSILAEARALVAKHDTTRAIALLRRATERHPKNAEFWYEYGVLLMERSRHGWRRGIMPAGVPNMIIAAESSLAIASRLRPDSAHYAVAHGKLLWGSSVFTISKAGQVLTHALDRLESEGNNPAALAEAADNLGIMQWRRYEPFIGRSAPVFSSEFVGRGTAKALQDYVNENLRIPDRLPGAYLGEQALEFFHRAREADGDNELYLRHTAMALAEHQRWVELAQIGGEHVARARTNPWGWLVMGLGQYRSGLLKEARVSFDSGFARLAVEDRERLESIRNLLTTRQQTWFDTLSTELQEEARTVFWRDVTPTRLLPVNPAYDEFRARAVFAELRFTDDEARKAGANTERGLIYLRYGPPDAVMQPNFNSQTALSEGAFLLPGNRPFADAFRVAVAGGLRANMQQEAETGSVMWLYFDDGLIFSFTQNRLFGTAYATPRTREMIDSLDRDMPVSFSNLPIVRAIIDTMGLQVARFRDTGDVMSLAVFAGFRPGHLRRGIQLDTSSLRHGALLLDPGGNEVVRRDGVVKSVERDTSKYTVLAYTLRTLSRDQHLHVEVLEPDVERVTYVRQEIAALPMKDFGISDILLARSIEPPADTANARWRNYRVAPLVGNRVYPGEPIALLWESYQATNTQGTVKLSVSVAIEREQGRGFAAIGSRVIGGIRTAVTGNNRNRVGISYVREVAATPLLVDYLAVDVGNLTPGRYRISLAVTDVGTGITERRTQGFVVVP